MNKPLMIALTATVLLASACTREAAPPKVGGSEAPPKITNRIDVPESVRNNLGITFVKVEKRVIAQTLRVPGRFEFTPAATREQRAASAGRVTLHVKHLDRVEKGTLLYSIDAPAWREMQMALHDGQVRIAQANAQLEIRKSLVEESTQEAILIQLRKKAALEEAVQAIAAHTKELEATSELWAKRVEDLEKLVASGVGKASDMVEARAHFSEAKSKLAEEREKRAELNLKLAETDVESGRITLAHDRLFREQQAAQTELESATSSLEIRLLHAAAMSGFSSELLRRIDSKNGEPTWRSLSKIEVIAEAPAVVAEVAASEGGWVEQGGLVVTLIDTTQVRVRARALQADMLRVMSGQQARMLPPVGGTLALEMPMEGKLAIALSGDPDERVIDLIVTPEKVLRWARPGVAVQVEITLDSTATPVLAIPLACVVRDELQRIFFRRDPNNLDKVARLVGEFGTTDGHWIEVKSGVLEGDEIVLQGVYELKLAGSAKPTGAGHFHADGTWHDTSHGETD